MNLGEILTSTRPVLKKKGVCVDHGKKPINVSFFA